MWLKCVLNCCVVVNNVTHQASFQSVQSNKEASVALSKRAALLAAAIVRELQKLDVETLIRRIGDINELLLFVIPSSSLSCMIDELELDWFKKSSHLTNDMQLVAG
jgi:hypothetical protein